jgi:hypothetical protein
MSIEVRDARKGDRRPIAGMDRIARERALRRLCVDKDDAPARPARGSTDPQ